MHGTRGVRLKLLTEANTGRSHTDEIVLFNSFGLAIEDLARARHVYRHALQSDPAPR